MLQAAVDQIATDVKQVATDVQTVDSTTGKLLEIQRLMAQKDNAKRQLDALEDEYGATCDKLAGEFVHTRASLHAEKKILRKNLFQAAKIALMLLVFAVGPFVVTIGIADFVRASEVGTNARHALASVVIVLRLVGIVSGLLFAYQVFAIRSKHVEFRTKEADAEAKMQRQADDAVSSFRRKTAELQRILDTPIPT